MTMPPVRPAQPDPTPGGYQPRYVSPYGHVAGMRARLGQWRERLGRDKLLPWVGLGLIADLEIAMQLLDLREFAEWLRTKGDPEHARFAADILADQETLEAARDACDAAGYRDEPDVVRAIEKLDADGKDGDAVRRVLIEVGALGEDDEDTDIASLVRALLG